MPWVPELFSAPTLQEVLENHRRADVLSVPFFDGLFVGDPDTLADSFVDEPELYDPMRGRVKGRDAFTAYVLEMKAWLAQSNASVADVERVILERRGFEEVLLHADSDDGPVDLPVAVVAEHQPGGLLTELRLYYSSWRLTGRHSVRPPLLQPDSTLTARDVVGDYQHALRAGDVDAIVATFEVDGFVREPAGRVHAGTQALRAFYEQMFSNGGGLSLEACTITETDSACAFEYNVVKWGDSTLPPQAGVAVFLRGHEGRLASVRIYEDVDPPIA